MTRDKNELRLEEVFASRGRVKVLKTIYELGEANITKIIKLTGLNYRSVINHLSYLLKVGLVEEVSIGRARIYRPKWVNPKSRVIEELISEFNSI